MTLECLDIHLPDESKLVCICLGTWPRLVSVGVVKADLRLEFASPVISQEFPRLDGQNQAHPALGVYRNNCLPVYAVSLDEESAPGNLQGCHGTCVKLISQPHPGATIPALRVGPRTPA